MTVAFRTAKPKLSMGGSRASRLTVKRFPMSASTKLAAAAATLAAAALYASAAFQKRKPADDRALDALRNSRVPGA